MRKFIRCVVLAIAFDAAQSLAATFTVSVTNSTGVGSLQQAITDANATAGPDSIIFSIPGTGPHVISPTSAQPLPSLTDPVTIDGYTQPGASVNTLTNGNDAMLQIRLHGGSAGSVNGLTLTGSGIVIRGLIITGFRNSVDGIRISAGASNNVVEGNFIGFLASGVTAGIGNGNHGVRIQNSSGNIIGGTNPASGNIISGNLQYGIVIETGAAANNNLILGNIIGLRADGSRAANGSGGIFVNGAPRNFIGGEQPGARNIISGNTGSGLRLSNAGATNNLVQGNFMGTDFAGTSSRSNTLNGIHLFDAPGNAVGGTNPAAANVFSGNSQNGIRLEGASRNNLVLGNRVGTDVTGMASLRNGSNGVFLVASFSGATPSLNTLGSVAPGGANIIAFNGSAGVLVAAGTNNPIRGNSLFLNNVLGIDLGTNGVTANDLGDADTGANLQQNFPVLTNAIVSRTNFVIQGRFNSRANTTFQLDFYANTTCDVTGHGQGRWWLNSAEVTTEGSGDAVFSVAFPGVSPGSIITATATDPSGNTSEFSPCLEMNAFIPTTTFAVTTTDDSGPGSLRQALLHANEQVSFDTIHFNIPGGGVKTIAPLSALPVPLDPVTLDGYTQPGTVPNTLTNGNNAALKVRLDGSLAGSPGIDGLHFTNTRGNVVRGLIVLRFSGDGIEFEGGGGNTVQDVWLGVDVNTGARPSDPLDDGNVTAQRQDGVCDGNGGSGLRFNNCEASTSSAVISSCNAEDGFLIEGPLAMGNAVINSCAGGDPSWLLDRGNEGSGFVCRDGARQNTFTDCTAIFNDGNAFACDQSNANAYEGCHAQECPDDAWKIEGDDNVLTDCSAYDVGGDACSIDSGIRNQISFARLDNIGGVFINLGSNANGGQTALGAFYAGHPGSGDLLRVTGEVSGPAGMYILNLMAEDKSVGTNLSFRRVGSLSFTKGAGIFVLNQVIETASQLSPLCRVRCFLQGPNGSSSDAETTVQLDNNPDVAVSLTVAPGSTPRLGDTLRTTLSVANNGVGTARDTTLVVTSQFPITQFLNLITTTNPSEVTLHFGDITTLFFDELPPGEVQNFTVGVTPDKTGSYTISASATLAIQSDGNPNNNNATNSGSVSSGISSSPTNVTQADRESAGDTLHPISTLTGELFEPMPPDLSLGGPMPLGFSRYYASFLKRIGRTGTLGDNWRHNFEWTLTNRVTTVDVITDLGRLITFTNLAGNYQLIGRLDLPFQLRTNGANFIMADPQSQRLYTFNSAGQLTQIADGHGNTHTLAYAADQLATVSDGLGRSLAFQYSTSGFLTNVSDGARSVALTQTGNNLTSMRSPLGLVSTYHYDLAHATSGLLTNATLPEGNVPYAQTFDASGRVATQTEAGTNTHTFTYANNLTTVTDPLGRTRRDIHTATGDLLAFTDEDSRTLAMGYDANGQRIAVADRLGNLTGLGIHPPSGYVSAITNADGTFTTLTYTNRSLSGVTFYDLAQITYPDGASERFTYDASGNILTRTDRGGNVFSFTYNARGQVLTAQNPLGGAVTNTYRADGTLASRGDSDTGVTQFLYDSFSRLTNVIHPDGTMIQATFDADDRVTSITDERNNTATFVYDDNGNVISATDPLSQTAQFTYDTRDRLLQSIDRLGKPFRVSYDALDHVASLTNRNGNVTQYTYDARRRLTSMTDPGNQVWSYGYDHEALLTSASNPLGQTNGIRRDALGYEVGFTNALNQSTSLVRDTLRRVTATVDALLRTNGFGYDSRGLLTNSAKPVVGTAAYERNSLGLLSRITDLNGSQWRFGHTPMGRAAFMADPLNRTNRFTYDSRGRRDVTTFPDGHAVTNSFDQASNTTRRQYSDGTDLQYTYDALNRIVAANELGLAYDAEGRVTNTVSSGVNYGAGHDAGGRLTNATYHAGAFAVTYTYDSRDRLLSVSDSLTGTALTFAYDDAGRLTGVTRPNGVNGGYTYDAAGRLTRIQEGGIVDLHYTLDPAGQVTNLNYTLPLDPTNGLSQSVSNWTHDAAHQISNAGHAYDARGRQTAAPGRTTQYDAASRLKQINAATLAYNGFNDLVTRVEAGLTNRYFYNHAILMNPIMAEQNANTGQIVRYYVWSPGGRLLYLIDAANGNAVRHFHFDRVGTTLALTDTAGAVTDAYAYTPYGELLDRTGTSQQPFLYVGGYGVRSEPGSRLYHMRARYYDPVSARFLTRDPIWPVLTQPLSLDPYQYAADNPLSFIDPRGLKDEFPEETISGPAPSARDVRHRAFANSRQKRDYSSPYWDLLIGGRESRLTGGAHEVEEFILHEIAPNGDDILTDVIPENPWGVLSLVDFFMATFTPETVPLGQGIWQTSEDYWDELDLYERDRDAEQKAEAERKRLKDSSPVEGVIPKHPKPEETILNEINEVLVII